VLLYGFIVGMLSLFWSAMAVYCKPLFTFDFCTVLMCAYVCKCQMNIMLFCLSVYNASIVLGHQQDFSAHVEN
jgi:hypothetical protein